jgi:hypothetical protein
MAGKVRLGDAFVIWARSGSVAKDHTALLTFAPAEPDLAAILRQGAVRQRFPPVVI